MSYRQGPWIRAWANFISSIYGKSMRKKIFVGVDKLGNRFYEYEKTRLNVKRFVIFINFSGCEYFTL